MIFWTEPCICFIFALPVVCVCIRDGVFGLLLQAAHYVLEWDVGYIFVRQGYDLMFLRTSKSNAWDDCL